MKKCGALCGVSGLVLGGAVLSVPVALGFHDETPLSSAGLWAAAFSCGIGAAYVLKSLCCTVRRGFALKKNSLDQVEVADRAAAKTYLDSLPCGCGVNCAVKPLLRAWSDGASGPQVARMAATQLSRGIWGVLGEAAVVVALLLTGGEIPGVPQCILDTVTLLLFLAPLLALARLQSVLAVSGWIERALLARIGNDTPAAAASDFAEKAAASVADSSQKLGSAVDDATKRLGTSLDSAISSLAADQKRAAQLIADNQKDVAEQLAKVAGVASSVEKLLQLQKSVDGTLRDVSATNEFKETLSELRRHLAEADQILKDAKKPRRLRLVESGE